LELKRLPIAVLGAPLSEGGHAERTQPLIEHTNERLGVELCPVAVDELATEPLPALLLLTGGTEAQAIAASERLSGPLLVLSHSTHNSLPAALETVAALHARGRRARLVHLEDTSAPVLRDLLSARALARALRSHRVGLIGGASPWLAASSPGKEILHRKLGIHVSELELSELLDRLPETASIVPEGEGVDVGDEEKSDAVRVLRALKELLSSNGWTALSLACFGLLRHKLTACWALSSLADQGIPAGCEGDLPALVGLIVAQELTGGPGFLANPTDIDTRHGRVRLAHCTVPLTLTHTHRLRTHFESGLGLAVEGELLPGPYTLTRFGGRSLELGFFVEGSILSGHEPKEDLCRTQAMFKMPRGAAQRLLRSPLGNHHVLIPGHWRSVLEAFHGLFLAESAERSE